MEERKHYEITRSTTEFDNKHSKIQEVMYVSKMFKLTRMSCAATYSKSRTKKAKDYEKKAELFKQWKKDEHRTFGPLLENSKERALREKSKTKSITVAHNVLERKIKGNVGDDSERSWALNISPERLCIIKQEAKSELSETDQQSTTKIVTTEEDSDIVTDKTDSPADKKELNDIINSINSTSLIHTAKSDVDKWESPEILSLPTNQEHYSLPGVTRILSESMSDKAKLLLENWKKRMILELGEAGFEAYRSDLLNNSKIMHSLIENTLKKEPVDVPDHLQLTYKSISSVLKDIKDVRFIESHVVHPTLGYRGFIDCIAEYKGNLCVIDWKKSDKLKTLGTMYDSPLQISAYIGALNSDENYSFKVKTGLLAIAYAQGQPPSVFELSGAKLEFYWKEWLKRLEKYYAMRFS